MILLICAALGLSHAYAQFTVGAKAGLNVASIGNVTVYPSNPLPGDLKSWTLEYGYLPGAHVGGYARYAFSPLFSVQTELLYSQMGYKIQRWISADTSMVTRRVACGCITSTYRSCFGLRCLAPDSLPRRGRNRDYYWAAMDR